MTQVRKMLHASTWQKLNHVQFILYLVASNGDGSRPNEFVSQASLDTKFHLQAVQHVSK
jgi:hypothetical protein